MGNYTPEQVEQRVNAIQDAVSAGRMTAPMVFTKMREIIAATLRQQAGRVDEGMLRNVLGNVVKSMRATGRSWGPTRQAQVLDTWADEIDTTLEAALAQNTQGEAVVTVGMFRGSDHTQDNYHGKGYEVTFSREDAGRLNDLPTGTKLYLHAERARVPEADVIGDAIEVVMEVRQFMESAKRFDAMKRMQKLAIDLEQLLAAAPSQRAEVDRG